MNEKAQKLYDLSGDLEFLAGALDDAIGLYLENRRKGEGTTGSIHLVCQRTEKLLMQLTEVAQTFDQMTGVKSEAA